MLSRRRPLCRMTFPSSERVPPKFINQKTAKRHLLALDSMLGSIVARSCRFRAPNRLRVLMRPETPPNMVMRKLFASQSLVLM